MVETNRTKALFLPHCRMPAATVKRPLPNPPKDTRFLKPLMPSPALAALIGPGPMSRTDATKRIWAYIKARNLQVENNKQHIRCDPPLAAVMGKPEVTMFEMTGLMSRHLTAAL